MLTTMTTFVDGPAKGKNLMLKRACFFLRVVEKKTSLLESEFDALDQPEDTPGPDEIIHVYQLTKNPGMCHLNIRKGGKHAGGFYPISEYRLCAEQPGDAVRDNSAWVKWCEDHKAIFEQFQSDQPQ
jgi:hypothetical protein